MNTDNIILQGVEVKYGTYTALMDINTTIKKDTIDKRYILLYRTMVNDYVKVVVCYGAVYQFIMKQFLYFISDIELEAEYLEDSVEQK